MQPLQTNSLTARIEAEILALYALDFLSDDADRLARFANLTGEPADDLRRRASSPKFLEAVLDFLLEDEPMLLAFAARRGIRPEAPYNARRKLLGAPAEH